MSGDRISNTVTTNVDLAVDEIRKSPVLEEPLKKGELRVVGAVYSLETGRVAWRSAAPTKAATPGHSASAHH
jgi:carbonic anhydrase